MSVIVNLAIFPLDQGEELADHVSRAVAIIRDSGLPHALGPMGTAMEGDYDAVMAVVKQCHDAMRAECRRVYLAITVDSREQPPGHAGGRLDQKVRAVRERLG